MTRTPMLRWQIYLLAIGALWLVAVGMTYVTRHWDGELPEGAPVVSERK